MVMGGASDRNLRDSFLRCKFLRDQLRFSRVMKPPNPNIPDRSQARTARPGGTVRRSAASE